MDDNRRTDHHEHLQAGVNPPATTDPTGGTQNSHQPMASNTHPQDPQKESTTDEMEIYRQKVETEKAKQAQYQAQVTAEGKADNWLNNELAKHVAVLDETTQQVIQYAASKSYTSLIEKEAELKKEIAKGYLQNKDYSHLDLTSAQKDRIQSGSFEGYQELREAEERHNQQQASKQLNNGLKSEAELKKMSASDRSIYEAERRSLDNYKHRYEQAVKKQGV